MTLRDIADLIEGEVVGDGLVEISGVSGLSDAREGDVTYVSGKRWLAELAESKASAVIVKEPIEGIDKPQIRTANPQYAFARLLAHFYVKPKPPGGISELAFVSERARVGQNVTISPFAYVADGAEIGSGTTIYPGVFVGEGSTLGEGCLVYPNVTIREGVRIGMRVIIHAGAVIGSDGFGYVFEGGMHQKIPQVGGVVIEDDVEIGANVAIDRATTGMTIIGRGTKVDNLVQIAHNVRLGKNVILVSQVGIAGSSEIGDGTVLAGQVGVADHVTIEAGTMIGAKSGIMSGLKRGAYSGIPVLPHREWLKAQAVFSKLPELKKRIDAIEEALRSLGK